MNIGKIIKENRIKKNLTQEELGKLVFVSKQAVSKWESGRTMPDIETFEKLAEILGFEKKHEGLLISPKNSYNDLRVSLICNEGNEDSHTDTANAACDEFFKDKKIGDLVELDGEKYYFMCRQELPDGDFCLLEQLEEYGSGLVILSENKSRRFDKIIRHISEKTGRAVISTEDAFDLGEDVALKVLDTKPLCMPDVEGYLPEMDDNSYFPIGHPLCNVCVTVDRFGNIWNQKSFCDFSAPHGERIIYSPQTKSGSPAAIARPIQGYLDGIYPIVINRHITESEILESMYIMEVGDLRLGPSVWIRNVRVSLPDNKIKSVEYRCVGTDSDNVINKSPILEERFYDCLAGLIHYYDDFLKDTAEINIPDKRLERSYYGTLLTVATLFDGPQAHYGHRFYSFINHNNFPPNYITSILAFTLSGNLSYVGLLVDYFFTFVVDPMGRIVYRQGPNNHHGFSASELGQLLWVISKYHRAAGDRSRVFGHEDRVRAMCDYICSKTVPSDIVDGAYVVRTCAEADDNCAVEL